MKSVKIGNKHVSPLMILAGIVVLAAVAAGAWYFYNNSQQKPAEFHEHANFAVFLNDVQFNFNQSKYMTNESTEVGKRQFVHMHDMNGGIIHLHAPGITLGRFFDSLGMQLNSTCLTLDNGSSYCTSENSSLKMYVNGAQANEFDALQLHDLDKVLISYGPHSDPMIQNQISSVPSDACIYSGKCAAPPGFVNTESLTCKTGQASICSAK